MPRGTIYNTQVFENEFKTGIQSDIHESEIQPSSYKDANNVALSESGKFLTLTNIYGTDDANEATVLSYVSDLLGYPTYDEAYNVMGVYAVSAKDRRSSTVNSDAIMIFLGYQTAADSYTFKVRLVRLYDGSVYDLYTRTSSDSRYLTAVADATLYSENDVEYVYVTDNVEGMYKIPALYNDFITGAEWTTEQVTIQRMKTNAKLNSISTNTDGSLECGSYQFAIRYLSSRTGKKSQWTLLTNPFKLGMSEGDSDGLPRGSIGGNTQKGITVVWDVEEAQIDDGTRIKYNFFEVAIVPQTDGTGAQTSAYITGQLSFDDYFDSGTDQITYPIYSLDGTTLYDVAKIVIDKAAIQYFNTLAIKNNRMFGGGVKYSEIIRRNGGIINAGGTNTIITRTITPREDDAEQSNYIGYFRDEVYRFAVAYVDAYGNWSQPKVLAMASVTGNEFTGNGPDFKFPSRLQTNGQLSKSMGLRLTISNHPDGAVGMAILRAERIKDIIAQTPIVPSIIVQPPIAGSGNNVNYPTQYYTGVNDPHTDSDAQPSQNPNGLIAPKNFNHTFAKNIVRSSTDYENCRYTKNILKNLGDSDDAYQTLFIHYLYPPELIYGDGNTKYESIDLDRERFYLDTVDYGMLSYRGLDFANDSSELIGDFKDTNHHGEFYASGFDDYYSYHNVGGSLPSLSYSDPTTEILGLSKVNYADESLILIEPRKTTPSSTSNATRTTSAVEDYSDLLDSYGEGKIPKPQDAYICTIDNQRSDVSQWMASALVDGGATAQNVFGINGRTIAAGMFHDQNPFMYDGSSYANTRANASGIEIANIRKRLSDDRYGDIYQQHNFFFTGAYADITSSSPVTVDVWGGDCHIGVFTFKISDRTYSIAGLDTGGTSSIADLQSRWGRTYHNATVANDTKRSIGLYGSSQYLSVILESEINPAGIEYNHVLSDNASKEYAESADGGESNVYTPFNYKYNKGMSSANNLKVFVPKSELEKATVSWYQDNSTVIKGRIHYSNIKVNNSFIEGFDTYNALDYYDMNEKYGDINKMIVSNDKLYCIQERGYAYIPVDERVIETATANELSVRSGIVINLPLYLNTSYGTIHPKTAIAYKNAFYFFDFNSKSIVKVENGEESIISDNGIIDYVNSLVGADASPLLGYDKQDISAIYDGPNRRYILTKKHNDQYSVLPLTIVYNDRFGVWESRWNVGSASTAIYDGTIDRSGRLWLVGKQDGVSNDLVLSEMYKGAVGTFFGELQTPYVVISINPNLSISNTYDNIQINATGSPGNISFDSYDPNTGYYMTSGEFSTNVKEGLYRAYIPRNTNALVGSTGQRIRGTYGLATIKFPTNKKISIIKVATELRPSKPLVG